MDARMGWLALLLAGSLATAAVVTAAHEKTPTPTMKAFSNEREFEAVLAQWRVKAERERRVDKMVMAAPPASVAGTALQADGSITNVQTTGEDSRGKHGIRERRRVDFTPAVPIAR